MNHLSILVMSWIVSTEMPRFNASKTQKERSTSTSSSFLSTSSSESFVNAFLVMVSMPSSMERTAFIMPASKLGAIAMISPVAFICVPRVFFAYTNLSNGHFGNFTTR